MPTYDYHCDACGHDFEKFQSMSSPLVKVCPKCGKKKVRRLIGTGAGLIFKGSGFYITDYRDKGYADKAKADTGASSETKPADAKPAETKAEAKPAGDAAAAAPTPAPTPAPKSAAPAKSETSRKGAKSKKD